MKTPAWNPRDFDPEWPFDLLATEFALNANSTALLIVDMQYNGLRSPLQPKLAQRAPKVAEYWSSRIEGGVVPNIRNLIDCFRSWRGRIVYTRNGNLTSTGDEVTARLKARSGQFKHPDRNEDYAIDARIAPADEDLVVDKLTSGAFTASLLDHALRNMGIKSLVITGILTDMCILGTARAASELGYNSLICEDACATLTARAHLEALLMHARVFGRVAATVDVLAELGGVG
jgi:nicotinamidase-related amidase